jgi:hypothetical protein
MTRLGILLERILEGLFGKSVGHGFVAWLLICAGTLGILRIAVGIISEWRGFSKEKMPGYWRLSSSGKLLGSPVAELWLVFALCLMVSVGFVIGGLLMMPSKNQAYLDFAVGTIKIAGGEITRDKNLPGNPVVRVDFERPVRLGTLATVVPYLESLPQLRYLRISSWAKISDTDLRHLEGLTQLETIDLYGRGITKSGLERLREKLPHVRIHWNYDLAEHGMEQLLPQHGLNP